MKKITFLFFFIFYYMFTLNGQSIIVNTLNMNQSYSLDNIIKFSFQNNRQNLKLIFNNNSVVDYSLDSILSLTFESQFSNINQIYEEDFLLFPNPFSSELNIQFNKKNNNYYSIKIINQLGLSILDNKSFEIEDGRIILKETNFLAPGLYFIEIKGDNWMIKKPVLHI